MKNVFATAALIAGLAASAQAGTYTTNATEWGTIQSGGPRTGSSGIRYLNVEGSSNGDYASDGYVRFDVSDLLATIPAGETIIDVDIILDSAPAGFSTDGNVDMYFFTGDDMDITNGENSGDSDGDFSHLDSSLLIYGDFQAFLDGANIPFGTATLFESDNFYSANTYPAAADITFSGNNQAGVDAVIADLQNDSVLSFALLAVEDATAATYRGAAYNDYERPRIVITTEESNPGIAGDFDNSGVVDADDIDALVAAIVGGSTDDAYNVDGANGVDSGDLSYLVGDILGADFGDANLDGSVDLLDLSALASNFQSNAGWSGGNFNTDAVVDLLDLSILASNFGATSSVPEPASAVLATLALVAISGRRG